MALNPLGHRTLFNDIKVQPSVTTFTDVERTDQPRIDPVNDLIVLSPFRSGKPLERNASRDLARIRAIHDPDLNGDQGVELCAVAKDGFADREVFGAPLLVTYRVGAATAAFLDVEDGGSNALLRIARNDYGSHTNGPGATIAAGTTEGKKITLTDGQRSFIGDDLGLLLSVKYDGDASTALLSVVHGQGKIAYAAVQPVDGATVVVNGVTFEFDNDAAVTPGNILVTIGATSDASWLNLANAIPGATSLTVTNDATGNSMTVDGVELGVVITTAIAGVTVTHHPPAARLRVVLAGDQLDGTANLDIPLKLSGFKSIDNLANYINQQLGYTASVRAGANPFLDSVGLDPLAATNCKVTVLLTGYVSAMVDWVNNKTRERYVATDLLVRAEPADATYSFAGGTTPPVTAADWTAALAAVEQTQVGGIILPDTDDPATLAAISTFIETQRGNGRWFRGCFGAQPGLTVDEYKTISAAIDHERCRLYVQRGGEFGERSVIVAKHPVYTAAAFAGAMAGNLPFVTPLTAKRVRIPTLIDEYDDTDIDSLLQAGITVLKRESDRIVCVLSVTTSHDPERRMPRIVAEMDTVDQIDQTIRDEFQGFRGRWTDPGLIGRARGVLTRILQEFTDLGALSAGVDADGNFEPAFEVLSITATAGAMTLKWLERIGGELDHVDGYGLASYTRFVDRVTEREVEVRIAA